MATKEFFLELKRLSSKVKIVRTDGIPLLRC